MDKPLKSIKSGFFSRGLALTKMGWQARRLFKSKNSAQWLEGTLVPDNVKEILMGWADELGQLKGSLMKVGQMLSVYGEHFLPPEANLLLKSLQTQSPPLEWTAQSFPLRTPPRESVFLDRKLGGSFVFVSILGAKIQARSLLEKYL